MKMRKFEEAKEKMKEHMKWVHAHRDSGTLELVMREFKEAAALLEAKPHSTNVSEISEGGFECRADFSTIEDADCFVEVLDRSGKYGFIAQI
jgi:hypothetical protein